MSTAWQAIGWWETRRVAFNLIVGSAGTISSVLVGVVGLGSYFLFDSDFGVPDPPLFALCAVVIYAIMANVCYTGGWVAELAIRKAWPEHDSRCNGQRRLSLLRRSQPGAPHDVRRESTRR